MDQTSLTYIRDQERRRRAGKVIPPILTRTLTPLPVTTAYGIPGPLSRWSLGHHTGEDHAAPAGSLVCSVSWGVVVCVARWNASGAVVEAPTGVVRNWGPAYGTHVIVRTASGAYDAGFCHLSAVLVAPGQQVRPGQTLGHSGATGNVSGPHLHLETRPAGGRFGTDVNPIKVKRMERKR